MATNLGEEILLGALFGHTTSSFVNALLNMRLVSRISLMTFRDQFAVIWRPALAASAMSCAVLGLSSFATYSPSLGSRVAALTASVGVGAVLYAACLSSFWLMSGRPRSAEAEIVSLVTKRVSALFGRS